MCLILFAYDHHPDFRLILAANRDEFHDRPTLPLHFWPDKPALLAGRDLKARGTWLGVTRRGRLAALTNFREPESVNSRAPSRGALVRDFLETELDAEAHLSRVAAMDAVYNGFNLLVGDINALWYYSNRGPGILRVPPGIHGISNHLMDTPWPKVTGGKAELERLIRTDAIDEEALFRLLGDRTPPPPEQLPDTGVGPVWERLLAPRFITSNVYGTRSSSLVLIRKDLTVRMVERTFPVGGADPPEPETRQFDLCWR
ncbi:MAG: NRDE family protein [Thermodesulfobacteriota bacterium]